jgi:transketolase
MTIHERHQKRIENYPLHNSMRGQFGFELYKQMAKNEDIVVITADLGYGLFDPHRDDFPDRFLNTGASEQAAVGIAVGMTYEGKIPIVYSITNFLLYRPYEWIRNYLEHEKAPVKLVASGRDMDYSNDGWSHHSPEAFKILDTMPNIMQMWPETKEYMIELVPELIGNGEPTFISLRR